MSGFLLVTGKWAERLSDERYTARLIQSMASRGASTSGPQRIDGAVILTVHHDWENTVAVSPRAPEETLLIAADASLYYEHALRERLRGRGVAAPSDSAAELIGQAFREFGTDCVQYLEGDYAFAVFDTRTRSVLAARDPFGTRSIYHATYDDGIAIASTPDPLRLLADRSEVCHNELIRSITGYHGDGTRSPWKGISELPAGWSLVARNLSVPRVERFWYPKVVPEWKRAAPREAALILRELIGDATRERMPSNGAAVGMSGGRDSTAIVGSVEDQRRRGLAQAIPPFTILSYRYPEGDPGNEDAFVDAISREFNLAIYWIDAAAISVFRNAIARADRRVRAEAQPFEGMNRALAVAARQHELRVVLNGNGGDNILGVADSWLADLFRSGRWIRLFKELRTRSYPSRSWILETCLRPAVPLSIMDFAERILGRRLLSRPWEHHAPRWLVAGALEREGIIEEDRESYRRDIASVTSSIAEQSRLWSLLYAGFSRNCAALFDMSLDEGTELRMPFYDQRVVNFAWSRDETDLNDGIEQKAILRQSMDQVLPSAVQAPRARRTGTTGKYFRRMAGKELEAFAAPILADPTLAKLGIVDEVLLRQDIEGWNVAAPEQQVFTLNACTIESWLRAHI